MLPVGLSRGNCREPSPLPTALLRAVGAAHLFLVALDDKQTSFRCHHLVRQLLRAELHARDRAREQELQLRAAEWFQAAGDTRRAARHLLAARRADRALALLGDRVVPDFLADPAMPPPLDVSTIDASVLAEAPDRLLAVAADLLLSGDTRRGGQYLDLLERVQPPIPRESRLGVRLMAFRSFRHALVGEADQAVSAALAARSLQEQMQLTDEWNVAAPMILPTAYAWLEDFPAVEREAAVALAAPELTEPVKLVMVPGVRALAWFEAGCLNRAAATAEAAHAQARRLGFDRHFFAVDYLRTLAGLALERRDLDTAEQSYSALHGFLPDCGPGASCDTSAKSIFGQGETWKSYQESMPSSCDHSNSGTYAVRHNPAVYYTALHGCSGADVSYSHLATDLAHNQLPAFSFITPNLIDDMHNGTVADDNKWLSRNLPTILASAEYRNGSTVVFITWDEGEGGGYASGEHCASKHNVRKNGIFSTMKPPFRSG